MPILPEAADDRGEVLMLYDLRDPDAWQQAHDDRRAWGKPWCDIFDLDQDHVVLRFRPGGALEGSA